MALANYADLQASIASHIDRTDQGANIPDFIALAEAEIQSDLRIRQGVISATLATVANEQKADLPADWQEFKAIYYQGVPLEYLPADRLREMDKDQ